MLSCCRGVVGWSPRWLSSTSAKMHEATQSSTEQDCGLNTLPAYSVDQRLQILEAINKRDMDQMLMLVYIHTV